MFHFGAWALRCIPFLLILQSGTLLGNRHGSPTRENPRPSPAGGPGSAEGGSLSSLRAFLESLEAEFLRNLNLSEMPSQEKAQEEPPQFMIDLYHRYTRDKSSSPIANVVRSFRPEDVKADALRKKMEMTHVIGTSVSGEDISSPSSLGITQKYVLLFNLSLPWHEEVTKAELRVHVACQREAECFPRVHGNVAIYDGHEGAHGEEAEGLKNVPCTRDIQGCGWVTFDVSSTVRKWVRAGKSGTVHRLEAAVKSDGPLRGFRCAHLNLTAAPGSNRLPSLVVFSNDHGKRAKADRGQLQETASHEQGDVLKSLAKHRGAHRPVHGAHPSLSRSKRSVELGHCRKTALRVNFKDIGWNWIIAPPDYEAFQCKGGCFYPLTDNVTPTKHAIVQTLVHYKNPKKALKACCVPTKLEAISMLYKDEAGTPTLKYEYEGMKVAECGCR